MNRFAALVEALESAPEAETRLALLVRYFREASAEDVAWSVRLLAAPPRKRVVRGRDLVAAAQTASGVPAWLVAESRKAVGDLAETAALLLPPPVAEDERPLASWIEHVLAPLADAPPDAVRAALIDAWRRLSRPGRIVFNKLATGTLRALAPQAVVMRALADAEGVPVADVWLRFVPGGAREGPLRHPEDATTEPDRSLALPDGAAPDGGASTGDGAAPYAVRAVLVYAQGSRASGLLRELTFALRHEGALVPFVRTAAGLADDEARRLDAWIRAHTIERFGPVRRVEPSRVYEIAFDAVTRSARRVSGIEVRGARVVRACDEAAEEADALDALRALAQPRR